MSDELVFYTHPQSRGRTVRWMLEEVGAPYTTELVDLDTTVKSPEYLAINPMGKVPAIRHGDTVVTEAAAICAYLADAFPEAGLAPPPAERGAYYRWLFFAAGPLEAAVLDHILGNELAPEMQRSVGYRGLERTLEVLGTALEGGGPCLRRAVYAADVYLASQLGLVMTLGVEMPAVIGPYLGRVGTREAATRAMEIDAPTA